MNSPSDRNVERYTLDPHGRDDENRFCLLGLIAYESDDPAIASKKNRLLDALRDQRGSGGQNRLVIECTMGNCDVTIAEDTRLGTRERAGMCVAADYCIKQAFEAVKGEDGVQAGRARYQKLMDTCEGRSGKYSAGNFCPRIDCDLSAGVSIDMVPGTDGECYVEIKSCQGQLFDPSK